MPSRLLPPDGVGNRKLDPPVRVLVEREKRWHAGEARVWRDSRYLVSYTDRSTSQSYLHWVPAERVMPDEDSDAEA